MTTDGDKPVDSAGKPELQPIILVIFGITGDLAQRKLLPALYQLFKHDLLHADTVIFGITRRDVTADEVLADVDLCVNDEDKTCDPKALAAVKKSLQMHQMSLTDGAEYDELLKTLNDIETKNGICMSRLYYLSIPPQMIEPIVRNLGEHGLNAGCLHEKSGSRLLVEKPFGYDYKSAEALIEETSTWFSEDQLFRIDHYVAKETVQNILAFRLFNPLFRDIWNRKHIVSVEITAFELITIEGRATFYEGVGALRDFLQNHLLQLLTTVTMELPASQRSQDIHASKLALLRSIKPIQPDEVAQRATRGQYETYKAEVEKDDSNTETYASLKLSIDDPRWEGVPMTIRTGKAMARKLTEIRIVFQGHTDQVGDPETAARNELVFNIQPNEGISLLLNAKKPGFATEQQSVLMDFNYQKTFDPQHPGEATHPDAYERVLVDAALGDHTLFTTSDEVLASWRIVENVLRAWSASGDDLHIYPKGSPTVG